MLRGAVPSGYTLIVNVTAMNWLGIGVSVAVTVTTLGVPLPSLFMQSARVTVRRSAAVSLLATLSTANGTAPVNYTLSWAQVVPGSAAAALLDPTTAASISAASLSLSSAATNNSQKLSLAPFSLSAGLAYAFSLTVRSNASFGVAVSVVNVSRSTLLAVVLGGNATVSLSSLAPSVVMLDGSHSVDPDSGDSSGMSFIWTCWRQLSGDACFVNNSLPSQAVLSLATAWFAQVCVCVIDWDRLCGCGANSIQAPEDSTAGPFVFTLSVAKDDRRSNASVLLTPTSQVQIHSFLRSSCAAGGRRFNPAVHRRRERLVPHHRARDGAVGRARQLLVEHR